MPKNTHSRAFRKFTPQGPWLNLSESTVEDQQELEMIRHARQDAALALRQSAEVSKDE